MAGPEPVATVVPLKAPPAARNSQAKPPQAKRRRKQGSVAALAAAALEAARTTDDVHSAHSASAPPSRASTVSTHQILPARALVLTVFTLGLVTAAVGLYLNASFLWKFGRTSEAGLVLAVVGFATDGVTLVLPATIAILWQRRRRGLALAGCGMYAIAVVMTFLTSIGFASSNIDDAIAGRGAAAAEREALVAEINRLRSERDRLVFAPADERAVAAAQTARDQECGRVGPNCRQRVAEFAVVLRDQAAAVRAAVIDERIAGDEARLKALPALASADPQTEAARAAVAWLSQGHLIASAEDIRMTRILGVGGILFMGGLLLAFGAVLRHPAGAVAQ